MTWSVENNALCAVLNDGRRYFVSTDELVTCLNENKITIDGQVFSSPIDELNLRLSQLCTRASITFEYINNHIVLNLIATKLGETYLVGRIGECFLGYVITGTTLSFLTDRASVCNELIASKHITPSSISYAEYISLRQYLDNEKIYFDDKVQYNIRHIKTDSTHFIASGLQGNLFDYQDCGCNWLSFMTENNCGCVLGDEMGLGKTLQVIALLGSQKEINPKAHFLVICPVSLLENWRREIDKFYPSLRTLVHHGSHRTGIYNDFYDFDVIITSYSNAQADRFMLNMIQWDIVIIDEAQNIKNPYAKRTKSVKDIARKMSIAVTGTPFENHMSDVWSIIDFILPGFLGTLGQFENKYTDNVESASALEELITPLMIRRRVTEVAKDLPKRIDIPVPIEMTDEEALYYERGRKRYLDEDPDLMDMSLDKIQGLRMFCTHPFVYDPSLSYNDPIALSNKYERLCSILEEIFANGEKAVVFTSFNKMIEILVQDIKLRFGVYTNFINGSVESTKRQGIIDEFSDKNGPGVLILNPRAAGAGLNITTANHAIHYNLEWNPAIEDQASARIYRKGQDKPVFIYRLYYTNTIEDIINEKIQNKRILSDTAIVGHQGESLSKEDLLRALSVTPYKQ